MRSVSLILRREMASYFTSPIAYLIAAGFLLLTGVSFNNELTFALGVRPLDPALIPRLLTQVMIFLAPLLTMRLLAEESREGTMELLLTAPISDLAIVLGKFLSAWLFYTLLLALTLVYQVIVFSVSRPDLAHVIAAYLGIWLYGGATLAIGLFFSALTENQIVAAFLSMVVLFVLYIGENVGQIVASVDLARLIFSLTLQGHFAPSFAVGLIRGEDVIYYAGVIVVALYLSIQALDARRLR
ncbi:MAG: ABC transporter permease [Anaerolineae bacterium]|nr:ABC transporter permease [Anaerolineae bacterium]MDW8173102.1 ABC transporter permease [Anaerolineae bacterium]